MMFNGFGKEWVRNKGARMHVRSLVKIEDGPSRFRALKMLNIYARSLFLMH